MAGRDLKDVRARRGGHDWFIDFEQGDLDLGVVTRRARQRPRQPSSAEPSGDARPKTTGPSPWVADFLLDQVDGAPRMPPAVRRESAPAAGSTRSAQGKPAEPAMAASGGAGARDTAATEKRVPDRPAEDFAAKLEAAPPAIAKAKTGGYAPRPYALAATLVLGLAGGLLALAEGYRGNTPPAEDAARAVLQARRPEQSREPWRELPARAAVISPPEGIVQAQLPLVSTRLGERPAEVAAVVGAPSVTLIAPGSPVAEASPPRRTVQTVRAPRPALTPLDAPVEVTARDADERQVAAAGSSPMEDGRKGAQANARVQPASAEPVTVPSSSEAAATGAQASNGTRLLNRSRVVRREDKRRQAVESTRSRVAQAAQPRSFALPAVLRPTSF